MYLFPLLDVAGKHPGWLVYMVSSALVKCMKRSLSFGFFVAFFLTDFGLAVFFEMSTWVPRSGIGSSSGSILSWLIVCFDVVVSCVLFVLCQILGSVNILFQGWVLAMLHSFLPLLLPSTCFWPGILWLHANILCFVLLMVSCKHCWFHLLLLMLL